MSSTALRPLQKRHMGDDVAERLRQAILGGELAPGQRLLEESLAETMQVSRGPVRNALVTLEREGLIVKESHRGTFVARLARGDAEEVHSLRLFLELLAAEWAVKNAGPEDLVKMEGIVRRMADCVAQGCSEKDATNLDIQFHEALVSSSRHQRLIDTWLNLRSQIRIVMLSNMYAVPANRADFHLAHGALLDALRQKDLNLLRYHLEEQQNRTFRVVIETYRD